MLTVGVILSRGAAVLLVPVVLLASGCGGSSGSSKKAASGLSKAEYVKASEAICAKANAELDALPDPKSAADIPQNFSQGLAIATRATADLEALGAKQPDAANLTKIFLGPIREQVTALTAYGSTITQAAAKGDAALESLAGPENLPKADTDAMKTYGFSACVKTADNS